MKRSRTGGNIRAVAVSAFLGSALLLGYTSCNAQQETSVQDTMVTLVHASSDWYLAAEAPERTWQGRLEERSIVVGPNTRSGLRYALSTDEGEIPVYETREDSPLAAFVGLEVEVKAKLVDLSAEGFGPELWVGSVRRRTP